MNGVLECAAHLKCKKNNLGDWLMYCRTVNRFDYYLCNSRWHCGDAIHSLPDNTFFICLNYIQHQFIDMQFFVGLILNPFFSAKTPEHEIRWGKIERHIGFWVAVSLCPERWHQRSRLGPTDWADRKKMGVSESGSIFLGTARCVQTCSRHPFANVCQLSHRGQSNSLLLTPRRWLFFTACSQVWRINR